MQTMPGIHDEMVDLSKYKSNRTRFLKWQVDDLKKIFQDCPYPDKARCEKLAQKLGLKQGQVYAWFRNRRERYKRKETVKPKKPDSQNTNDASNVHKNKHKVLYTPVDENGKDLVCNAVSEQDNTALEHVIVANESGTLNTVTLYATDKNVTIENVTSGMSNDLPAVNNVDKLSGTNGNNENRTLESVTLNATDKNVTNGNVSSDVNNDLPDINRVNGPIDTSEDIYELLNQTNENSKEETIDSQEMDELLAALKPP